MMPVVYKYHMTIQNLTVKAKVCKPAMQRISTSPKLEYNLLQRPKIPESQYPSKEHKEHMFYYAVEYRHNSLDRLTDACKSAR
jgi:hypothetical protein